jgi:hypothetical protein
VPTEPVAGVPPRQGAGGGRCLLFTAALLIVAYCPPVWAGVTGTIAGTITDASGAAVVGATVKAVQTETGITQTVHTDDRGYYSFLALAIGHYDLEVTQSGFKDYQQKGLAIDVNTALRVDVSLQVGGVTQHVEVTAAGVHAETTNTQMGELIGSSKVTAIPLNGRSYTDLLALQPGVVPVTSDQYRWYNSTPVSGALNPGGLSVSGSRESANGFIVNGGNVEEGVANAAAVIPNLDSIAEFRILTSGSDAEYGNYSGGQINVVTKSGTSQLHGDVFEFLRNTNLDARNFFSPQLGSYHQNQFGGTAGGPIKRDKVFFFADYQGTRQVIGQSTGEISVPSAAERSGDFSGVTNELTGSVSGDNWASVLTQQLGYPVTAGEAYYTPSCATTAQCVFPGAVIPSSGFSAPARALLQYIPTPNVPGGFFSTTSYKETLVDDKGSGRIDANTRWGAITGYYFMDNYDLNSPYPNSGASLPGFNAVTVGRAQMINVSDTKIFGGNAVNELRLHYMRDANIFAKPQGGVGPTLSSQGFVEGAGGIVPLDPKDEGVIPIMFNNFSIGVPSFPKTQIENTFQIMDSFSKVRGAHTMKFGVNLHYNQITVLANAYNNGQFQFLGNETGVDFADFLIGAPSSFVQGQQEPLYSRSKYAGWYAQDSWRARSNLTINYGLRWDYTTPWYEKNNQIETIAPGVQSVVFPGAPTGWVFPGDPGIPPTMAPTPRDDFAPRIGLAYAPSFHDGVLGKLAGGPGKSSIRASYGVFYTALEDITDLNEFGDAPFGLTWVSPVPPQFTTPYVDRATGHSEGQRFPAPLPPLNASPQNPDSTLNWAQFLPISSSPGYYPKNRTPYSENYGLSLQRQFGNSSLLTISYVGSQGHRLVSDLEANPGNPALCLSVSQISEVAPGSPTCAPFGENGVYTTAAGQVINSTRGPLGPDFGSLAWFDNMANSNYNALQTSFRHVTDRWEFLASYTYSKSLDNASGFADVVNPVNYRLSKGLSTFDMTHNFVLSYRYILPFDKFFSANRASKGWILTGITRFATGQPVTMLESDDNSLLGTFYSGPTYYTADTPDYLGGNLGIKNPRTGLPYFNTSLFTPEALGQIGTSDRRFFHGPGLNNFDLALLKDLPLTESKSFQFRVEFFNVFNHAQFESPNGNVDSGTAFGLVTAAQNPRIGQVAVKFLF